MADYHLFTSARATLPDPVALTTAIRAATGDVTTVLANQFDGTWKGKKATAWTAPQIASVQNALDTTAEFTPQLQAQRFIDSMSIYDKARDLATIDALNTLRALHSLAAITPAQAISAIRAKAGTL